MADSNFRGPINSMGSLEVNAATTTVEPLDGPSMLYQGAATPDIRSAPFAKDGYRPGQQAAFLVGSDFSLIDQIPQARTSTNLAAAQVMTSALAVALVTAQPAGVASSALIAIGVPILPIGTTVATVANMALDFGFATGTTVAASSTVIVVDNRVFRQGQWIIIGGAGNSSASRSHIAQVVSIATANITTITISPVAVTAVVNAPIGQGNLFGDSILPTGTQFGPTTASASVHSFGGAFEAGLAKVYNPREMLTRNIAITSVTAIPNAYSAIVSGWDVWGNPMTELISCAATVTTFVGKKAFKYISHITSGTSVAVQTIAIGLGDTIGIPMRADYWEQAQVNWNGSAMTNSNGFVAALATPTSSSTTADVRGTFMLSTAIVTGSGIATAISAIPSNGTSRLSVIVNLSPSQQILATPLNPIPQFGVAQSTATT